MAGTISDWIIAAEKKGLEDAVKDWHTKKFEDNERLRKSGLPIFDGFITPYKEFGKDNAKLIEFLSKGTDFVVRAIPKTKKLPRKYQIGVHSFDECKEFLQEVVKKDNEELYSVFLTANSYANRSGIIISNIKQVIAEVGECGLEKLSHGENPSSTLSIDLTKVGHITNKTDWKKRNPETDKLVWRALKYIELTRDSFNPHFMRGYFEFLITKEKNEIKFMDYKTNEMYIK